ncbi:MULTISPECIES: NAD(P)/FAD-dependent oxidoreductase [Psychrilyobacter]|uniref:FAD-dependent oxidoreductase n=1 Tax=Psychrilyobacter piezotolerans TaxID=2293438 RepID=A0ABX9KIU9_9FUSO|nr:MULTISPECIES: NAD(P)/FAD-dependent oxidoreductase [Psychrilyobacter]MCS5421131.1 NAD(P)/FAD-dependent oxidoreductase [Psychrilyobacter sp. S5]NDI77097.1 FAD-dependent oxidoreductase [Psychrilyobacter piezotolerans]RDE64097.1 FAD-dependent oxidoreductase [Psychrilyobacter sp. S5]REI42189.1 FAD-dependent oxidoreductase [Psychrilyobacter piezotolerans]
MFRSIFQPIKIGNLEIKNRLVNTGVATSYCNPDGIATNRLIEYYEARAKGGWGLIITDNYGIDELCKDSPFVPGVWNDEQIESHSKLTERVHNYGGRIVAQIGHPGREVKNYLSLPKAVVAPSPIKDPNTFYPLDVPHELNVEEIKEIVENFSDAALRVKKAGYDGVELKGGYGYLINQFLSPFSNKRTDEYGGTILNRCRFLLEIIESVREKVGEDYLISVRISADEFVDGGLTIEDSKVIARLLEKAGIDLLNVAFGVYKSMYYMAPPSAVPHGFFVDLASEIKKIVSIPVIAVGRINTPLIAETVLLSEKADLVAMSRAGLADPELPNKAKEGRLEDIIHCIGCLQGCVGAYFKGQPVHCLVNPESGKEKELSIKPALNKKKVFIVGGGIAGMEAAIVAAKRGHEVHLYEKEDKLGGQWLLAAVPPHKEELNTLTVWQKTQLGKLGVNIFLKTELTEEIVDKENPDAVIIATGANPIVPGIPGVDSGNVIIAQDILAGRKNTGNNVVVIGGGQVGAETAAHLANHGSRVTIVEMQDAIAKLGIPLVNHFLMKDLKENNVNIMLNTAVKEIFEDSVLVERNNEEIKLDNIDTVVMAIGSRSENKLADILKNKVKEVITIGDAVKVRDGINALEEGYKAGLQI